MKYAGKLSLLGLLALSAACGGDGTGSGNGNKPGAPAAITASAGTGQTAAAGAPLPTAPAVHVAEAKGRPTPGVTVTWAVTGGGGTANPGTSTTDANGNATTTWTLGGSLGAQGLSATVAGVAPLGFTATATAGAPASLTIVAGNAQTGTVGTAVPVAPAVKVADAFGNPVANVAVAFAVVSGGGTVTGATGTTNAQGIATAGGWTLGTLAGANILKATAAGLAELNFTATGTAGPAAQVAVIAGGSQLAIAREQQAQDVVFAVNDAYGNPVPNATVTFTAANGTVAPSAGVTGTNGTIGTRLTVSDVQTAAPVTITASANGATAPVSAAAKFYGRRPALIYNRITQDFGRIWAMDWLTRTERLLTTAGEDANMGVLSPDGSVLAYARWNGSTGFYDVVLKQLSTGAVSSVFSSASADGFYPRFSPSGDSIVYTTVDGATGTVRVALYARHSGVTIANLLSSTSSVLAAVGPGGLLAYSGAFSPGQWDLVTKAIGAAPARLTTTTAMDEIGVVFISPTRLLYTCAPLDAALDEVQQDVCVINTDGSGFATVVADPGWDDFDATVSRDGKWLAFASIPLDGSSDSDIYYAPTSGGTLAMVPTATTDDEIESHFGVIGWTPAAALQAMRAAGPAGLPTAAARARLARATRDLRPMLRQGTRNQRHTGTTRRVF